MYGYLTSLAFRVLDLGTGCSHTGLLLQARPTSTKRKGSGELSPSIIWWCNQTANNALFRYLLWSVHPPEKYSWSIITTPAVAKKMSFLLFQDLYCHSSSDVMCHATKCCNVIGLHYMDTACMHRSPHPSLLQKCVLLARLGLGMRLILIDIELRLKPFTTCNVQCTCRQNMFHATLKKFLGQLQLNHHTWPSYVGIWHHFYWHT